MDLDPGKNRKKAKAMPKRSTLLVDRRPIKLPGRNYVNIPPGPACHRGLMRAIRLAGFSLFDRVAVPVLNSEGIHVRHKTELSCGAGVMRRGIADLLCRRRGGRGG